MRNLVGCTLACALIACAQARAPGNAETDERAAQPSPSRDSTQSVADPAAWQAVQRSLSRSSSGLHNEQFLGGIRKIDLQRRFQHVTVIEHGEGAPARRVCLDRPRER